MKREELTEKILDLKRERGWSWKHITDQIGGVSPVLVVGAVYGKPFWGPSISRGHCWTDNSFHRHCNKHWSAR